MHAAQQAGPLEHGEVAPHRLGGDAELLGDGGDRHPAALGDQPGDGVLALLGVQLASTSPPGHGAGLGVDRPATDARSCGFVIAYVLFYVGSVDKSRGSRDSGHRTVLPPPPSSEVSMSSTTSGTESLPATSGPVVLTGTPVVPGVALGPVVRPAGAVRLPEGDRAGRAGERAGRRRSSGSARPPRRSPSRLAARAAAATGVSAEVLAATAGLARDRGLLSAVEQRIDAGRPAEVATVRGRPAVRRHVHRPRRADGRAGDRRPRRPRPDRGRADRSGGAGRADARRCPRCCSPTTWRRPTPRGWTRPGSSAWPPGWAARPATPRSSPASSGLPCVVAVGGLDDVPAGATRAPRRRAGHRHRRPRPGRGSGAGRRRPAAAAEALAGYTGPGADP